MNLLSYHCFIPLYKRKPPERGLEGLFSQGGPFFEQAASSGIIRFVYAAISAEAMVGMDL